MKIILIIFVQLFFYLSLSAQDSLPVSVQDSIREKIIGVWQESTSQESDDWLNTYSFFKNSTFVFTFSRYLGFNRIQSLSGKYRIQNDTLAILVEKRKEIVGGYIFNHNNSGASLGWLLKGGKEKIITQKPQIWESCKLEFCTPDIVADENVHPKQSILCLWIFDNHYYKIRDNPFLKE